MKWLTKEILARALAGSLALAACLGWLRAAGASELLPETILRLHVVASSDSPEDQALKLAVRDAVLAEAARWCQDAKTMEEANREICTHLEGICQVAEKTVKEKGFSQTVTAQVTEEFFPTKDYEGFSLPAGRYRALRIVLGEGEGHNWWCVVFPALCLPAAAEGQGDLLAALPESQRDLAENPGRYQLGLKAAEWFEELRDWLRGE